MSVSVSVKGFYLRVFDLKIVLFSVSMRVGVTVKIHELRVPEITKMGNAVILDCDYSLEDSLDEGLVVKWFFNQQPIPVYQWIPAKRPQAVGILKNKLNLEYRASQDKNTMHRALHILKCGVELSGDWSCLVSTFKNEDKMTKKMTVFGEKVRIYWPIR